MAKYPISHNAGKKLGEFFHNLLVFHIPPSKDKKILDPTCGKKHLWTEFYIPDIYGHTKLEKYGKVVFADIVDYGQEIVSNIKKLRVSETFDGIIFDPPYFFGYSGSKDPRRKDYGGYAQSYKDLLWFMNFANRKFPNWLTDDGKLIVKCSDQYQTKERKFYPHHYTWIKKLTKFNLVDLLIFIHHRMSPTAFQVKNRPCSVIMHTFFLVFKKQPIS